MTRILLSALFVVATSSAAFADPCYCQCLFSSSGSGNSWYLTMDNGKKWKELGDADRGSCGDLDGESCKGKKGEEGEKDNCTHVKPTELEEASYFEGDDYEDEEGYEAAIFE